MATAFDAEAEGALGVGVTTGSFTHTPVGTPSIVFVCIEDQNLLGISAPTYGGNTMTLITSPADPVVTVGYIYYLANPPAGAQTVGLTRASGVDNLWAYSLTYTGTATSGIPDASTTGSGTAASLTGTLTTIADNAWTLLVCYMDNAGIAAGTGSTQRGTTQGTVSAVFDSNGALTPPGSKSMSVTASSGSNFNYVMVSFGPAGAAQGTITHNLSLLGVGN